MPILPPFKGPHLKIARAIHHITALRETAAEFGKTSKIEAVPVGKRKHLIAWRVQFTQQPPCEIPALIGDATHNLRAALDLLIYDLARVREKSTKKLAFPFAPNEEKFEEALDGPIKRLGEDIILELRSLKSFRGGNVALRGLHDLDIIDKHHLVLPVYLVAKMRAPLVDQALSMFGIQSNLYAPVAEGNIIHVAEGHDPGGIFRPVEDWATPWFPKGLPFAGKPVIETLEHLSKLVTEILSVFETKFGSRNSPASSPPTRNDENIVDC